MTKYRIYRDKTGYHHAQYKWLCFWLNITGHAFVTDNCYIGSLRFAERQIEGHKVDISLKAENRKLAGVVK